jgi:hypothetical protein
MVAALYVWRVFVGAAGVLATPTNGHSRGGW